jgi:hypothetical protein
MAQTFYDDNTGDDFLNVDIFLASPGKLLFYDAF